MRNKCEFEHETNRLNLIQDQILDDIKQIMDDNKVKEKIKLMKLIWDLVSNQLEQEERCGDVE